MSSPVLHHCGGQVNLQATLSASSAGGDSPAPHHPITCTSDLRLEQDGTFACEHAEVGPADERLKFCLNHTVALLIMECAYAADL